MPLMKGSRWMNKITEDLRKRTDDVRTVAARRVIKTRDCKKEEIKENKRDIKHGIKSECRVVSKRLNFKIKTEDCQRVYLADQYEDLMPVKNEFFIPTEILTEMTRTYKLRRKKRVSNTIFSTMQKDKRRISVMQTT
ncbi:uncharacterized protein [Centruroides vittatus]|uniref:uncharacterized protein n=1 Tax=Centruroides vittatus TaxID=120091 RepID=UPI00350F7774